jgi:predicted enzyme related to lactoylglutathione lyase
VTSAHAAGTAVVDDIRRATAAVEAAGGEVLIAPLSSPIGMRMVAMHPEGTQMEYLESGGGGVGVPPAEN